MMMRTTLLYLILGLSISTNVVLHIYNQRLITKINVVETKQDQITLMISGEYEPIDLTYLPRITKKEGLKEKE
jgi:hypothetical protein